jgi:hypothetical protein
MIATFASINTHSHSSTLPGCGGAMGLLLLLPSCCARGLRALCLRQWCHWASRFACGGENKRSDVPLTQGMLQQRTAWMRWGHGAPLTVAIMLCNRAARPVSSPLVL